MVALVVRAYAPCGFRLAPRASRLAPTPCASRLDRQPPAITQVRDGHRGNDLGEAHDAGILVAQAFEVGFDLKPAHRAAARTPVPFGVIAPGEILRPSR